MFVCAVAELTSTVFLICMLSVSVCQDATLATPSSVDAVTDLLTSSSTSRTVVYLHPTMPYGSPLNLSVVLDVRSDFELSFRTCSHGSLLSQSSDDPRNYFQLVLDENGSLNVSLSSSTSSSSVLLGRDLNNNDWYKFVWTYQDLGDVTVSVEQDAAVLYEVMFSNTSVSQDLWSVNLANGSELHVGDGSFEGCLRDGPQMWFSSAAEVDDTAVLWHSCRNGTNCERTVNSCSSSPCANNGRFDSYHV